MLAVVIGVSLTLCQEAEKAAKEQEKREFDIARGNPLLNPKDFTVKRRYVQLNPFLQSLTVLDGTTM
jgi:hypothetical protein